MKKKMIRTCLIVLSIAVAVCIGLSALLIGLTSRSNAEDDAVSTLDIFLNEWNKYTDAEGLVKLSDNAKSRYRLTIVAAETGGGVKAGQVVADSSRDPAQMENHLNREEIQAALNKHAGTFVRSSDTVGAKMLYYAKLAKTPSPDGYAVILRIAIPISHVDNYFLSYFMISIVVIVLVGVALLLLWIKLSEGIYRPLTIIRKNLEDVAEGEYIKRFVSSSDEEMNAILMQIGDISDKIDSSFKQLREEKHKIDFIVDHLKEGIVALNADNEVVLINSTAKKLFGFRPGNLGKHIEYTTSTPAILEALTGPEGLKAFDVSFGEKIYSVTVTAVREERTGLVNKIAVLSDVTAKRNSEELREEFFSNASHELKTPVTSIRGFSELMKDETDPEKLSKYARRIYADSTRIMNLLSDMLKLSKLDENYQDEELAEVDLASLCGETEADVRPRLEAKGMTLSVEGNKTIRCYPSKTRDLVSNLVDNAVKYSNAGGAVRIKITAKFLSVSDDGIGIEKKHLSRIFERFFMADSSRSKKEGGTGLGLSIVKHICRVHNWTPRIDSKPGEGTTVTVVF